MDLKYLLAFFHARVLLDFFSLALTLTMLDLDIATNNIHFMNGVL